MNTSQLQYFISLAKTLSFTAVAKEFYMSQPAVSHQIKSLEEELGVSLFIRQPYGVELTSAGLEFLKYAEKILKTQEDSKKAMAAIANGKVGSLDIFFMPGMDKSLNACVREFHKRYPEIGLNLIHAHIDVMNNAIKNREGDLYFGLQRVFESSGASVVHVTSRSAYYLYMPKEYSERVTNKDLSALSELPLLLTQSASIDAKGTYINLLKRRYVSEPRIEVMSSQTSVVLGVGIGLGYTIMVAPSFLLGVPENAAAMKLEGQDEGAVCTVGWHNDNPNLAAQKFIEVIRELYPDGPEFATSD